MSDFVGSTHAYGRYYFTSNDYLNEGADRLLSLGSRTIKLYLHDPKGAYPFNSDWPSSYKTVVELPQLPYFKAVFAKNFTNYILTTYSTTNRKDINYWRKGISDGNIQEETKQFYELTKYMLQTYRGTNKTFVFQHWEGDWSLRGNYKPEDDPTPTAIESMIKWLNARQAGVDKARDEVGMDNVYVYHAAEVNLVYLSIAQGKPNLVNKVLPYTNVDLASYSSYDTMTSPEFFRKALDFIQANSPKSKYFTNSSVYIGEFGLPENEFKYEEILAMTKNVVETCLDFGCPYILWWELFDNGCKGKPTPKQNSGM
jgi:hypothetical protein